MMLSHSHSYEERQDAVPLPILTTSGNPSSLPRTEANHASLISSGNTVFSDYGDRDGWSGRKPLFETGRHG